jgi:hypothetical protein
MKLSGATFSARGLGSKPLSVAWCVVLSLLTFHSVTVAQTRQFLDAPVVESRIRVRWNAAGKSMQWEADNREPYRAIQSDTLFLTKTSIYITYPQLNPLSVQATASAVAVDDPAYATITKLIDAITSVATTVAPTVPAAPPPGAAPPVRAACSSARDDIHDLYVLLYGPDTTADAVGKKVAAWSAAIDGAFKTGKSGPQAIADGVTAIKRDAATYQQYVDNSKKAWSAIQACVTSAATPAAQQDLYAAVSLDDQNPRIQQLTALVAAANSLADLLTKQYEPDEKWMSRDKTDYVISQEIGPTFAKMDTVTVKVMNITLKVDSTTSAVSTDQQLAGSATFNVRRYSSLTPEVGVGAVFGSIKQPKYGTGTNSAGQTIVVRESDTSLSVNPTILANFVCRCGTGLLVPMLQIGAATSKTLPAILAGGGLRLFGLGKGDVAVGGGAMFAWYKDLRTLQVGQVVSGTAAIDADLGYSSTPKVGGYFAIQYKF